jgi:hypothetical protein
MSDPQNRDLPDPQALQAATSARISSDERGEVPAVTSEEAYEAFVALDGLDWSQGLTRDQIRRKYRQLPVPIYLRLPSSKHFTSPEEVLHDAGVASSRAEGDFMGANPGLPDEDSVSDGGPPAWGGDPIFNGDVQDGGSAEDTEGLEEGE